MERAKRLKVGNGLDETTEMGPAINERQLKADLSYVEIGKSEGAKLKCGGNRLDQGDYQHGFFMEPTVFTDVDPEDAHRPGRNFRAGGLHHSLRRPGRRD